MEDAYNSDQAGGVRYIEMPYIDPEEEGEGARGVVAQIRQELMLLAGELAEPGESPEPVGDQQPIGGVPGPLEALQLPLENQVEAQQQPDQPNENQEPDLGEEPHAQLAEQPQPRVPAVVLVDPPPVPSPPSTSRRNQGEEPGVISLDTPSPPKKRKRLSAAADKSLKKSPEISDKD